MSDKRDNEDEARTVKAGGQAFLPGQRPTKGDAVTLVFLGQDD